MAADGAKQVTDAVRPRWRKIVGTVLLAQLVLVPAVAFAYVSHQDKPEPRVGLVMAPDAKRPVPEIVYAACSGEHIKHLVLTQAGSTTILWSAIGDVPADQPITIGKHVDGLKTRQALERPPSPQADLSIAVSTDRFPSPAKLDFTMQDVPTSGALTFDGTYANEAAFKAAALRRMPCGSEKDTTVPALKKLLVGQGALAAIGVALLVVPFYREPRGTKVA